jgi:hypothetical protein
LAFVTGQHDIGGFVQQGPHPPVPALRDAADVVDLARLIAPWNQAQIGTDISGSANAGARQLIVGDYAKAAREIAETLARLASIETDLRALNARLPAYTGYIQIEAFRGHGPTLGQTVVLPAITPDDAAFWPTRPRRQTINELYARS